MINRALIFSLLLFSLASPSPFLPHFTAACATPSPSAPARPVESSSGKVSAPPATSPGTAPSVVFPPPPSQGTPEKKPGEEAKGEKGSGKGSTVTVRQQADHLSYNDKTKMYHMWGRVKIWREDAVLTADEAEYSSQEEAARVWGRPKLVNPEVTLTGKEIVVFYKDKTALVRGDVSLIYKKNPEKEKSSGGAPPRGKADGGNQKPKEKKKGKDVLGQSPVLLTAPEIMYNWKEKMAVATGRVRIVQEEKIALADRLTFFETGEISILEGNVILQRGKKDSLTCDKLTMFGKREEAVAEGNVRGSFEVKKEEKEKGKEKPPSQVASGGRKVEVQEGEGVLVEGEVVP